VCPEEPEQEEHTVEEVFEDVVMQQVKPIRMMLNGHRYQGDTKYIK
jgi:hypothetical protein